MDRAQPPTLITKHLGVQRPVVDLPQFSRNNVQARRDGSVDWRIGRKGNRIVILEGGNSMKALALFLLAGGLMLPQSCAQAQTSGQACPTPAPANLQNCSSQGSGSAIECLQNNICFLDAKIQSLAQSQPASVAKVCKHGIVDVIVNLTDVTVGFRPTSVKITGLGEPPPPWDPAEHGFWIITQKRGQAQWEACH